MLIKALGLKCMSMIQKERERDEIEVKERITHIEEKKTKKKNCTFQHPYLAVYRPVQLSAGLPSS